MKEIIALIVLVLLMVVTVTVGAYFIINNVNSANEALKNTYPSATQAESGEDVTASETEEATETTQADEESTEATATEKKNENNSDSQKATSSSKPSNNSKPNKNSSSSKNDKNSNTPSSNNTGEIPQIVPETKPVEKDEDVLKINGVKCNVGNTVTITLDLRTPKALENFQGFTKYDDSYLKFISVSGNASGLFNDHESAIYYNGSDIMKGYDFTNKGTLYTATFKVLKKGSTEITNTFQVMSDRKSTPVLPEDCEISIGIFN